VLVTQLALLLVVVDITVGVVVNEEVAVFHIEREVLVADVSEFVFGLVLCDEVVPGGGLHFSLFWLVIGGGINGNDGEWADKG
jgi:hypothetical protein